MTELADEILRMLDAGHKPEEIAEVLDCSASHVWRVSRANRGPRRIKERNLLAAKAASYAFHIARTKHKLLLLEMELLRIEEQRSRSHAPR